MARPPLARDRLSLHESGWVEWRLRWQFSDGTTRFYFSPKEFIGKLAALIPRPRANLVVYHGVLAANANDRAAIVPGAPEAARRRKKKRNGRRQLRKWIPWSDLMLRALDLDVVECPRCGGRLKIVRKVPYPTPEDLAGLGLLPMARPSGLRAAPAAWPGRRP